MRALRFTHEDLVVNRGGHLTESQLKWLIETYRPGASKQWLGWAAVLTPLSYAVLAFGMGQWGMHRDLGISIGMALFILLVTFSYMRRIWDRAHEDAMHEAEHYHLVTLDGEVQRGSRTWERRQCSLIHVSGMAFMVPDSVARAFEEGQRYRLYFVFVGLDKPIMSAELLPA